MMYSVQYVHPTIDEKNASPKLKVNTVFMFSKCNCNIIPFIFIFCPGLKIEIQVVQLTQSIKNAF